MTSWSQRRINMKTEAKLALGGNWFRGAFLVFLNSIISAFSLSFIPIYRPESLSVTQPLSFKQLFSIFIPETITPNYLALVFFSICILLLLTSPLVMGMHSFFLRASRGEKPKIRVAFLWYLNLKQVFGSIFLVVSLFLLRIFWMAVFLAIPVTLVWFTPKLGPLATIFSVPFYIAGTIAYLLKIMSYIPAQFLYADNPEQGVVASILKSVRKTRGYRAELLVFRLSLILWYLLVFLTYPIGEFLFTPYEKITTARYVDMITNKEPPAPTKTPHSFQ